MEGYILRTHRAKDEDLIAEILTPQALVQAYRFYGLRHSQLLAGHKIDFALEENPSFLPRLREVLHLGFAWLLQREVMLIWQDFIRLLSSHLRDVGELEGFYFELLEESARRLSRQNPRRVILDAYARLLAFEGRLRGLGEGCFVCEGEFTSAGGQNTSIVLARAFLPAHPHCLFGRNFAAKKLGIFYSTKNSSIFEDEEVEGLFEILREGL